jgi:flagellar biogenesis protein FliO
MRRPYFDGIKEWIIQAFVVLSLAITLLGVVIWQLRRLLEFFSWK